MTDESRLLIAFPFACTASSSTPPPHFCTPVAKQNIVLQHNGPQLYYINALQRGWLIPQKAVQAPQVVFELKI